MRPQVLQRWRGRPDAFHGSHKAVAPMTVCLLCFYSVEDVSALRQQLRSSQRSLKKSETSNIQLMREMKRLEERLQKMTRLQQLIADRQLKELQTDGGGPSTQRATSDSQPSTF